MAVCHQCGGSVPTGNRFCGLCGSKQDAPPEAPTPVVIIPPTLYTRLVQIKGQGFDSASFRLKAGNYKIGRTEGELVFPEDPFLSNQHAQLFTQNSQLFIEDIGSENGVFIKLKSSQVVENEDTFLVGEQLLQFEKTRNYREREIERVDESNIYGCSPEERIYFQVRQLFPEAQEGAVFYSSTNNISIGREQCDLSFPFDRHISGQHARLFVEGDQCHLQDLGSKNGTYIRIKKATPLHNGDYFFVGQQLLRVEIEAL